MLTDEIINDINSLHKYLPVKSGHDVSPTWVAAINSLRYAWDRIYKKIVRENMEDEKAVKKIKKVIDVLDLYARSGQPSYKQYYFLAASIRYQAGYSKREITVINVNNFIDQLKNDWMGIHQSIDLSQSASCRQKIIISDKHYTIYHDPQHPLYQYFLVSPLLLAKPTGRAYVKMVVPLIVYTDGMLIKLSDPYALKVEFYEADHYPGMEEHKLLYGYTTFNRSSATKYEVIKRRAIFKIFPGMTCKRIIETYMDDPNVPFSWRDVFTIFIAIAKALQAIHAKGYLHLDIKPANIILNNLQQSDGHRTFVAYIIDADNMHRIGETKKQTYIGTFDYNAPELNPFYMGTLQTHLDIYALGKIFIEIVECMRKKHLACSSVLPRIEKIHLNKLLSAMTAENPNGRCNLKETLSQLQNLLAKVTGQPSPGLTIHLAELHGRADMRVSMSSSSPTMQWESFVQECPVHEETNLLSLAEKTSGCCIIL